MAAFELRQQLKLGQQLIMTPQLQQAIKLLQLSRLELLETIHQELETNPLLEETVEEVSTNEEMQTEQIPSEAPFEEVTVSEKVRDDFDWESYLDEYSAGTHVLKETDHGQEWPSYDQNLTSPDSLNENLIGQLRLTNLSETQKVIGALIIGNLNNDGYLEATLEEIAQMGEVSVREVEEILSRVQRFDPIGIAARDLRECLLLQARNMDLQNDLVLGILENHFHYLESRNYAGLVRALKSTPEEVKAAIDIILGFNPRPGCEFEGDTTEYISPDVYVMKVDDEFVIILNENGMPKLKVSSYYKEALTKNSGTSSDTKDYIQDKLRSAAWLIKSIHQRQRTLYKVAQSIVRLQSEFFEKGVAHLKPMVLRDVAEDVGMHESTISRVTASKYMHTSHGIFELKYFFNSSINSVLGEAYASESIKDRIRNLIRNEDSSKPYSDQDIVTILKQENVDIARRTVAKYREVLNILPSSKRKKTFWAN